MSSDAAFAPLQAAGPFWCGWEQENWCWVMGAFGLFWATLILVAIVLFLRTSRRQVPEGDYTSGAQTRWSDSEANFATTGVENPSPMPPRSISHGGERTAGS